MEVFYIQSERISFTAINFYSPITGISLVITSVTIFPANNFFVCMCELFSTHSSKTSVKFFSGKLKTAINADGIKFSSDNITTSLRDDFYERKFDNNN